MSSSELFLTIGIGIAVAIVWWLNDIPDDRNDWRRK